MPLYEYKCEACGHKEEALLTFARAQATPFLCPKCKKQMTRLTSAFAHFRFVGNMQRI